jgi:hypothetical protein
MWREHELDLMTKPRPGESSLTEQQDRCHTLVREVALWRAALSEWKERLDRYEQAIEPDRRELHAAWREWVLALDAASLQPGLSRADREQLSDLEPTRGGVRSRFGRNGPRAAGRRAYASGRPTLRSRCSIRCATCTASWRAHCTRTANRMRSSASGRRR